MKILEIIKQRTPGFMAIVTFLIATYALINWWFQTWQNLNLHPDYIPIAPLTSMLFLILSISLISYCIFKKRNFARIPVLIASVVTLIISSLTLMQNIVPFIPWLETIFFPTLETVGEIPVGRMSPATAVSFVFTSLAIILNFSALAKMFVIRQIAALSSLAVCLFAFAISVSYITGVPLLYGVLTIPVAFITAILFLLINLANILYNRSDIWPLSAFSMGDQTLRNASVQFRYSIVSALVLFSLSIGTISIMYMRSEANETKYSIREQLNSIAELKTGQITEWLMERKKDAILFQETKIIYQPAMRIIQNRSNPDDYYLLLNWASTFINAYGYCSISLLDAQGREIIKIPEHISFSHPKFDPEFGEALNTGNIVLGDVYRDKTPHGLAYHESHIKIWVPISMEGAPEKVLGVWRLQISPDIHLFPLIRSWPTPSRTAETLLVRKENGSALFINDLRHRKNTALKLEIPIVKNETIPAVAAVLGHEGFFDGIDYRSVPVIAVIKPVKMTSWYLIAKIDSEEIYAPLRAKGLLTGSTILIIILAASWMVSLLVRRREDAETLRLAKQWSTTFDTVRDVIWLLDADFTIIRANQATYEKFGTSPESVIGKKCWEIVHKSVAIHPNCPMHEMRRTNSHTVSEMQIGDTWNLVILDPILNEDGQLTGVVHTVSDITSQKLAQLEIQTLNENLEETVRKRTSQLEASNKELEAFSYSVSHDLRSPLRAIDGWSLVILEDFSDQLSDETKKHFESIRSETQRMGELIDTLIRLSKVTRTSMTPALISLSDLAKQVFEKLNRHHEYNNVKLSIKPDLSCHADPYLMEIVLTNLISNALKFSSNQGEPEIELGKFQLDNTDAYFIRDNGAGFDMKYVDKLFGAFQRLHKSTEFSGTGIGLAMVKRIIERHGGKVWAESEINKYSIFYFTLGEE